MISIPPRIYGGRKAPLPGEPVTRAGPGVARPRSGTRDRDAGDGAGAPPGGPARRPGVGPNLCPALPGGHQPVGSILRASRCLHGVAWTCRQLPAMDGGYSGHESGRHAGCDPQQQQPGCVFLGDLCVRGWPLMGSLELSVLWSGVLRSRRAEERGKGTCFPPFTAISISLGTAGLWCCITFLLTEVFGFRSANQHFRKRLNFVFLSLAALAKSRKQDIMTQLDRKLAPISHLLTQVLRLGI